MQRNASGRMHDSESRATLRVVRAAPQTRPTREKNFHGLNQDGHAAQRVWRPARLGESRD